MTLLSSISIASLFFISQYKPQLNPQSKSDAFEAIALINEFNRSESYIPDNKYLISQFYKLHSTTHFIKSRTRIDIESIGPDNIPGRMIAIDINPNDTNEIWAGSASGGLWKSTTGGIGQPGWVYVPIGYSCNSISAITINPLNPKTIYIGTGEIYSFTGADGGLHNRILRGGYGIGILKSVDGGKSWVLNDKLDIGQKGITEIIIHPTDTNSIFVATSNGMYRSIDNGNTWQYMLRNLFISDILIPKKNSNVILAGVGGCFSPEQSIYKSFDYGNTWHKLTDEFNNNQGRVMLAAYPKDEDLMIAIMSDSFKTTNILRSKTQFESYYKSSTKDITTYQGWYSKCLHIKDNDSSKLIAGGVDLFLDNSEYGSGFYNLLTDKLRYHVDFHGVISNPKDPNKLYFITDGGVYRSNDFCKTIFPINNGLNTAQFYYASVSTTKKNTYIGGLQDNRSALYVGNNNWKNIHYGDGTCSAFISSDPQDIFCASQQLEIYRSIDTGTTWKKLLNRNTSACFISKFIASKWNPSILYVGSDKLLISSDTANTWRAYGLPSQSNPILTIHEPESSSDHILLSTITSRNYPSKLYKFNLRANQFTDITANLPNRNIRDIATSTTNKIYLALSGYQTDHIYRSDDYGISWQDKNESLPDIPFHTLLIDPLHPEIIYAGSDFGLFVSYDEANTWTYIPIQNYDIVKIYDLEYSPVDRQIIIFSHGNGAFRLDALEPKNTTLVADYKNNIYNLINLHSLIDLNHDVKNIRIVDLSGKISLTYTNQNDLLKLIPGIHIIQYAVKGKSFTKKIIIY